MSERGVAGPHGQRRSATEKGVALTPAAAWTDREHATLGETPEAAGRAGRSRGASRQARAQTGSGCAPGAGATGPGLLLGSTKTFQDRLCGWTFNSVNALKRMNCKGCERLDKAV